MINKYIYVPEYKEGNCAVIYNSNTIRVYDTIPTYNSEVSYRDYFPGLNYSYNVGTQRFSEYSTIPTCRDVTTSVMYSVNYDLILQTIIIILGCVIFLYSWLREMFRR